MNSRAQIQLLADGRRLHMQDGPIDLIVEAFGNNSEIENAYREASNRFLTVLDELCNELTTLRQPWRHDLTVRGAIAQRMLRAVATAWAKYVYHSDGRRCRCSRRRNSCIDDSKRATFKSLRE